MLFLGLVEGDLTSVSVGDLVRVTEWGVTGEITIALEEAYLGGLETDGVGSEEIIEVEENAFASLRGGLEFLDRSRFGPI